MAGSNAIQKDGALMIKWYGIDARFSGFTYYPVLEIGVGIFLMIAALVVPALFLIYNGIRVEDWGELLFCAFFFLLFMFMGRSLTFQTLSVKRTEKGYIFFQDLREPPTIIELIKQEWIGIKTDDLDIGEEKFIILKLKTQEDEKEFYRSVNRNEINKITAALDTLRKSNGEEEKEEE